VKDFDRWNQRKINIDRSMLNLFFKEQEVWWCRCGLNIGIESNGKGEEFARPVLILKKHNKNSCLVVNLTSKSKNSKHYFEIDKQKHPNIYANLSQIKVVDSKRLISRIFYLSENSFVKVKIKIREYNSL